MDKNELRNELAQLLGNAGEQNVRQRLDDLFLHIGKRRNFDCQAFWDWYLGKGITSSGFMAKCAIADIDAGKFDGVPDPEQDKGRFIDTSEWLADINIRYSRKDWVVKEYGHKEWDGDCVFIDIALNALWQETDSTIGEVREFHRTVVEWLKSKGMLTIADYAKALRRSKTLSSKGIDMAEIDKRVSDSMRQQEEFDNLLNND